MKTLIPRSELPNQPVYCETLRAGEMVNTYLSEPVNSFSNGFIFMAVLVGFIMLWQHRNVLNKHRLITLSIALMFLLLNAIGSWLWHSTKNTQWLPLDVLPALLFLAILMYFWMERLFRSQLHITCAVSSTFLIPAAWVIFGVLVLDIRNSIWMPIGFTLSVLLVFLSFIHLSWQKLPKKALQQGLWTLIAMMIAAFFRGIDIPVCSSIPFGTHFLWHYGLSMSAVLGLRFVLTLQKNRV